jgi:hypothetical protein
MNGLNAPRSTSWQPWHPEEAARLLSGTTAAWCVAGGWALDLWIGEQTRQHEDLEIAVPRDQVSLILSKLADFHFFTVKNSVLSAICGEFTIPNDVHQIRVREPAVGTWCMDIFVEPGDSKTWVYRRDTAIRCERAKLVGISCSGVPFLNPEAVLLYKSKAPTQKDEADFARFSPRMDPIARDWLRDMLLRVDPQNKWIGALAEF